MCLYADRYASLAVRCYQSIMSKFKKNRKDHSVGSEEADCMFPVCLLVVSEQAALADMTAALLEPTTKSILIGLKIALELI